MRQIPTMFKILFSFMGIITALGGIATYSNGYDFPVFAFVTLGGLLVFAVTTNRSAWVVPLFSIMIADEVGALIGGAIDPSFQADPLVSIIVIGLEIWLLVAWLKFERSPLPADPAGPAINL